MDMKNYACIATGLCIALPVMVSCKKSNDTNTTSPDLLVNKWNLIKDSSYRLYCIYYFDCYLYKK